MTAPAVNLTTTSGVKGSLKLRSESGYGQTKPGASSSAHADAGPALSHPTLQNPGYEALSAAAPCSAEHYSLADGAGTTLAQP